MAEARTYKSIDECTHANLEAQMGGCPDCNYTVGTILAATEDHLAQARTEAARYRAALERLCRCMERDPDDGVCLAHHVLNGGEL